MQQKVHNDHPKTFLFFAKHDDIRPKMELVRGLIIQSTIEYPSFHEARNQLQKNYF